MKTWITVCQTCKRPDWECDVQEMTDGERLAQFVEELALPHDTLAVRRVSCVMGCKAACNVTLQQEGKLSYTLGRFEPNELSAAAIVDYALLYAKNASGQVPFRDWPEAIKGHFITRHHPIPKSENLPKGSA